MTTPITAKPWSVIVDPNDIRVSHMTRGLLDLSDVMTTMPIWAPAIIREAMAEIEKLRAAVEAPTASGIQPIETAPRDGSRVDIWVRRNNRERPYRVADAGYSTYLRRPDNTQTSGWFVNHNGRHGQSFFDADGEVVGWSPIPEFGA